MMDLKEEENKEFGYLGTADHFIARSASSRGCHGETCALIWKDFGTKWKDGEAMKSKEGWRVTKQFEFWKAEKEKYRKFWTDGSPELKEGIEKLGAVHDTSVAGRPTNNSRIERLNRTILEGVRCILLDQVYHLSFGHTHLGTIACV